ncbi:helix-turn-helix domain-containing protein [Pseudoalteromonas umbrosa]|uniref:helix-turn-helix domain-containing protein n=1 Tax=Pseudoalteromonas umbrosa TaxID=3048489 RepID=UPI0024C42BE7|nr:helix-turn-helix transcriptional regulator [Pseudoalteromonas sp. B95]MDK1290328.1 helix-turn-helix transcriptional regulator [Pseudoalteromonas sp. B95]
MISGDDLKAMRKKAGFTQKQMADKLNITRETVSNYELGVGEPRMSHFFKWLAYCKIDINPLMIQISNVSSKLNDPKDIKDKE